MPDVSVIIACLNGAETLPAALASLVAQAWDRPFEILLADNGSTDASVAVFEACARAHPAVPMRVVDAGQAKGKSHALNVGIRAARGRALLFCDADDTVAPGWLAAMGRALETQSFVAARLDIRTLNPAWVVAQRRQEQEHQLGVLPHAPHCSIAGGATLGFYRAVFDAVGGFDPAFAYLEDDDFCVRAHLAGFALAYVPEAVYNYRFRADLAAIYRQGYNYAYWRALLRRRYAAEPLLAPRPWLRLGSRIARLQLQRLGRALRPRVSDGRGSNDRGANDRVLSEAAHLNRKLGGAVGDLAGSLAFRVAPHRPRRKAAPPGGHLLTPPA